jgi:hypothetical protein
MTRSFGRGTIGACLLVGVLILAESAIPSAAYADSGEPCRNSAMAVGDYIAVAAKCQTPASSASDIVVANNSEAPAYDAYRWVSACIGIDQANQASTMLECGAARVCPDPVERLWRLWGHRTPPNAGWDLLGSQCFGRPPTAAQTPVPVVTPGMVLQAIRAIGLPSLEAHTQPAGKTLVNFATIFYTSPEPFTRTIRLLGQPVHVEATATSFTWHHGDGTIATTTTPGAPYPDKQITYAYGTAHTTVRTSVDVTYTARFRVGGGDWQSIPETVTISGPASDLRISEATAVLSGDYQ